MSDGFLGRWSQAQARSATEGKRGGRWPPRCPCPHAPHSPAGEGVHAPACRIASLPPRRGAGAALEAAQTAAAAAHPRGRRRPHRRVGLQRFAARDVSPEVKNAAMKKLFTDPRYNVMDGLDVYIDDYSKPDPIPHAHAAASSPAPRSSGSSTRRRARRRSRRAEPRDVADNPTAQTVAQSGSVKQPQYPSRTDHADPDLRLQQDDAAPGEDPGRGTG